MAPCWEGLTPTNPVDPKMGRRRRSKTRLEHTHFSSVTAVLAWVGWLMPAFYADYCYLTFMLITPVQTSSFQNIATKNKCCQN